MSGLGSGTGLRITRGADKAVTDLGDIAPPPRWGPWAVARALGGLSACWAAQRGALMPWSAVMLGLGVAIYFALPWEPQRAGFAATALVMVLAVVGAIRWRAGIGPLFVAVAMIALGVLAAGYRSHSLA